MYDVAIIGAGPAGLTLAGLLDKSLSVLLVDAKSHPHKRVACGEWVPAMFPVTPVTATKSMITTYCDKITEMKFPGKIIDRESWQKSLMEELEHVDIHLGDRVVHVEHGYIDTDTNSYKASLIVGADGPNSIVRRSFNMPTEPVLPAVNVRMRATTKSDSTQIFFMPEIEKGYGWHFPKGDYVNVGVGTTGDIGKTLKFFTDYLTDKGLVESPANELSAGLIPMFGANGYVNENIVLVGDSAGLTDPLTGAGISTACDSATELARVINNKLPIKSYKKTIDRVYGRFIDRRLARRKKFEEKWGNLTDAVESSWILKEG